MSNTTKAILILAVVLLLIIAGVGVYFLLTRGKNIPTSEANNNQSMDELRKELESVYNKQRQAAINNDYEAFSESVSFIDMPTREEFLKEGPLSEEDILWFYPDIEEMVFLKVERLGDLAGYFNLHFSTFRGIENPEFNKIYDTLVKAKDNENWESYFNRVIANDSKPDDYSLNLKLILFRKIDGKWRVLDESFGIGWHIDSNSIEDQNRLIEKRLSENERFQLSYYAKPRGEFTLTDARYKNGELIIDLEVERGILKPEMVNTELKGKILKIEKLFSKNNQNSTLSEATSKSGVVRAKLTGLEEEDLLLLKNEIGAVFVFFEKKD